MSIPLMPVLSQNELDLRKLIGQGYDGDATFVGKISGDHKCIQTSSAHAIYIHCSCHRLQLASIQAAASVKEKGCFFNFDQRLEVVLLFPPKSRGIKAHPGCSWFSRAEDRKPSTRWLLHERCGKFAMNCLHCCKLFHSYTSHLEMLRHMVYTPFWLVLMVYQADISYPVPLLSYLFMQ